MTQDRTKGPRFEREVLEFFQQFWPDDVCYIGNQENGGDAEADIETPVFWVEAKHRSRKKSIISAVRQVERDADPARIPIVVSKKDDGVPVVTMRLDYFEAILHLAIDRLDVRARDFRKAIRDAVRRRFS